ncbi:hypothetical protein [Anaerosolibacter sp.]|uniref:hypothetical protein n=1 Tax=Anaerosolibacter sp. TaxID=1872527 RepID=UPI0039EF7C41
MDERMNAFFDDFRRFLDSKLATVDVSTDQGQAQYDVLQEVIIELQKHKKLQENWEDER